MGSKNLKAEHFEQQGNGAVLMNDEGRKRFVTAWQKRKKEIITHPFLNEMIPWGAGSSCASHVVGTDDPG